MATRIEQGDTFFKRFKGLMGRKSLSDNQGFFLKPCRSIHTCQMRFPIDVLFLSKEGIVLEIVQSMPPWQLKTAPKQADSTLELAANMAKTYGLAIGDKLVLQ